MRSLPFNGWKRLKWLWRELTDVQKYKSLQKAKWCLGGFLSAPSGNLIFMISSRRTGLGCYFNDDLTKWTTFIKTEKIADVKWNWRILVIDWTKGQTKVQYMVVLNWKSDYEWVKLSAMIIENAVFQGLLSYPWVTTSFYISFPAWEHKVSDFWKEKIRKNRERDQKNFQKLINMDWKVIRLWKHDVKKDLSNCVSRITESISERSI